MPIQTYVTAFHWLSDSMVKKDPCAKARLRSFSPQTQGLAIVALVALLTIALGSVAVRTNHQFLPLILLGLFYGGLLSYPAIRFLGPRVQSAVAGFTGGVTAGNIGTQQAKLREAVVDLSSWLSTHLASVAPAGAPQLNEAIVWCAWTTIISTLAIMLANAYCANVDSIPVGNVSPVPCKEDTAGPALVQTA